MIFSEEKYRFMHAALKEAEKAFEKEEIPVGCVVVYDNKIIGKGHNQVEQLKDTTAHAEMIAITAASHFLQSKFLTECEIFITVEPCLMCSGAIMMARIPVVYFGTFEPKFGAAGSKYNLLEKDNSNIKVYSGLLDKEAKSLLQNFFSKKRNDKI